MTAWTRWTHSLQRYQNHYKRIGRNILPKLIDPTPMKRFQQPCSSRPWPVFRTHHGTRIVCIRRIPSIYPPPLPRDHYLSPPSISNLRIWDDRIWATPDLKIFAPAARCIQGRMCYFGPPQARFFWVQGLYTRGNALILLAAGAKKYDLGAHTRGNTVPSR